MSWHKKLLAMSWHSTPSLYEWLNMKWELGRPCDEEPVSPRLLYMERCGLLFIHFNLSIISNETRAVMRQERKAAPKKASDSTRMEWRSCRVFMKVRTERRETTSDRMDDRCAGVNPPGTATIRMVTVRSGMSIRSPQTNNETDVTEYLLLFRMNAIPTI